MTDPTVVVDRRGFLIRVVMGAGGVVVSGMAPVSLLEAATNCPVSPLAVDPCGDWQLDDMCAAYPPYAFRTGAAVPHTSPRQVDAAGADWHWIA